MSRVAGLRSVTTRIAVSISASLVVSSAAVACSSGRSLGLDWRVIVEVVGYAVLSTDIIE